MKENIAIIGAGNMGHAIADGLMQHGLSRREQLILTNTKTHNNKEAASQAGVIILAVKPQIFEGILQEIGSSAKDSLIISVAAGVTLQTIAEGLGEENLRIVRVMPNLAAKVGKGMSNWVANQYVTEGDRILVRQILGAVGKEQEATYEDDLNVTTAGSGSALAFLLLVDEWLAEFMQKHGLSEKSANITAEQTLIGAAALLKESGMSAGALRLAITSKRGTTAAGFEQVKREMLDLRFNKVLEETLRRARELGENK